MRHLNYGQLLTWAVVVLYLGAAVGYWAAKDYRRAWYFFFAACLTVTLAV